MLGQGILETQNIFYYSNFLDSITDLYIFLGLAIHLEEFKFSLVFVTGEFVLQATDCITEVIVV